MSMAEYDITGDVKVDNGERRPHLDDDGTLVVPVSYCWQGTGMVLWRARNIDAELMIEYGDNHAVKLSQQDDDDTVVTGILSTNRKRDGVQDDYRYYRRRFDDLNTAFEALYALRESFRFIAPIGADSVLLEGEKLDNAGRIEDVAEYHELRDRANAEEAGVSWLYEELPVSVGEADRVPWSSVDVERYVTDGRVHREVWYDVGAYWFELFYNTYSGDYVLVVQDSYGDKCREVRVKTVEELEATLREESVRFSDATSSELQPRRTVKRGDVDG